MDLKFSFFLSQCSDLLSLLIQFLKINKIPTDSPQEKTKSPEISAENISPCIFVDKGWITAGEVRLANTDCLLKRNGIISEWQLVFASRTSPSVISLLLGTPHPSQMDHFRVLLIIETEKNWKYFQLVHLVPTRFQFIGNYSKKLLGPGARFLVAYNIWTDKLIKFHPILMVRLIAPGQTVGTFSIWLLGSENLLKLCFPNSKKNPLVLLN